MSAKTYRKICLIMCGMLVFITVMSILSYFSADGTAVIGPNPASVEVQRADIVSNYLWAALFASGVALFSFGMSKFMASIDAL